MLSKLLLDFIVILLAAQRTKSTIIVDVDTCQNNVAAVTSDWNEAASIARFTFYRTQGADQNRLGNRGDMRVTYNAFTAYFVNNPRENIEPTVTALLSKSVLLIYEQSLDSLLLTLLYMWLSSIV